LPGKHVLTAMAESPVSKGMSAPVEVTRTGAKDDELPNLYVLAVGVSAYPGPLALNYAHRDAIVLEQTLRERAGGVFRKVETRLLTEDKATRRGVAEGLVWLKEVMTARDVAVVFFAGHGARDPAGKFYFIPVDVKLKDLEGTAVPGDLLKQALGSMP